MNETEAFNKAITQKYQNMSIHDIVLQCLEDSKEWFPDAAPSVPFMALAITGELGEFCNMLKKMIRGGRTFEDLTPEEQLAMRYEVIDVFIYLMNICGLMQINIPVLYGLKREINTGRFRVYSGEENQNGQGS